MEEEKANDPLTFSPVEEEDNEELSDDDDGSTSSSEDAEEWNNTTVVQHELKTSRAASKVMIIKVWQIWNMFPENWNFSDF